MKQTYPYIHQVTVQPEGTRLVKANPKRARLYIFNKSATETVELGHNKKSRYGQGIPIIKTTAYENKGYCQGEYWGVCLAAQTIDVRIEEDIER